VSPIARTVAAARPESLPMAPGDRLRWVLNKDSAATRRGWSQGPTNTLTATPSFSIDRPIEVSNQQRRTVLHLTGVGMPAEEAKGPTGHATGAPHNAEGAHE